MQELLAKDQSALQAYRTKLAEFFMNHCTDEATVILEVPYQLTQARQVQKLIDFFRKDKRGAKVNFMQRSTFLKVGIDIYRLITAYLLLQVNCDKIMHAL